MLFYVRRTRLSALVPLPSTPCPSSTETTVIGLSVSNIVSSQILVSVKLNGAGRTSGAVDNVHLVKDAPFQSVVLSL